MKKRDLRHIGIYEDKKGRFILYNPKKKEGYIIPDNAINRVATMQYRIYLVLSIAVVLLFLFKLDWWIALLAVVALFVAMEFIYRKSMLGSYSIITNYTPANIMDKSVDVYKQSPKSILIRVVLYGVLGILMIMTIWGKPLTTPDVQVMMVVAAFTLINSIYHIVVYIKTRK